jgi:hypothetical protein
MMRRVSVCLGIFALAGGCTADSGDESILVYKNVHAGDDCTTSAAINETGWSHGGLDVLLPSAYIFVAQLKSRVTAEDGQEDQRTIFTSGANIDITFPGSTLFSDAELADLRTAGLTHYRDPFVAPIAPNGGVTDVPFQLVPEELVERIIKKADLNQRFRLETLATFTVVGDMSGGSVSSQPFAYAITIGNGVSINVTGSCSMLATDFSARTGYSCNPAQDGVIDCCTAPGGLVCPAASTASASVQ